MFKQFIRRSITLIGAGVALGLAARLILGVPEAAEQDERKFHRPIDTHSKSIEDNTPIYPLDPDLLEE